MSIIRQCSPNVEQEKAHKNTIPEDATTPESVSESRDEKDQVLLLSRELAVRLNPKRPDFNGALIIYGLYLWQRMRIPSFGYVPMVGEKRGCYRSLRELHEQYPWMSEEGIRKSLNRAEKVLPKDFVVDRNNGTAERGKLHFHLSTRLIETFGFNQGPSEFFDTAKGCVGLLKSEALEFGLLDSILLRNLRFVLQPKYNQDPVVDKEGRIYRELSPTRLTKPREDKNGELRPPLPTSRKNLTDALNRLKARKKIIEHPLKNNFYRLTVDADLRNSDVTKVAGSVTKVASDVTKVATTVTKVASANVPSAAKPSASEALEPMSESSISNTYRNPNKNTDRKCVYPSSVSRCSTANGFGQECSPCAKKLMELVTNELAQHQQSVSSGVSLDTVEAHRVFRVIDYDKKEFIGYDLSHDFIAVEAYSGKPYSRKREIDNCIDEMLMAFEIEELPFQEKDIEKLRNLFLLHPTLTSDDLLPLVHHRPYSIGFGYIPAPKKGHDFHHWARRIKNVKQFLRYLPQLIREHYVFEEYGISGLKTDYVIAENGRPLFCHAGMIEPLLTIAFQDEKVIPVTHEELCHEDEDITYRPIYYPEYVGLPTIDLVTCEFNPTAA
jgi:hypothetical protein